MGVALVGQVFHITSPQSVDEAWEAYASMARRLSDDSALLFDRGFNEELARRHDRWRKLFLMGERA